MSESKKIIALMPAAGIGARAKRQSTAAILTSDLPKQYELVNGTPMLRLSVLAMLADPRIDQVRVVVSPTDTWAERVLAGLPRTTWRYVGGDTRAETIFNGLQDLQAEKKTQDEDWVVVHDAARPGLPAEALERLISTCLEQNQGGLLALPVPDTVKRAQPVEAGAIPGAEQTLDRDELWLAQTPQMFKVGALLEALSNAKEQGLTVTDEASAMEQAGYSPLLVQGAPQNFKITWPDDFQLLEKWL